MVMTRYTFTSTMGHTRTGLQKYLLASVAVGFTVLAGGWMFHWEPMPSIKKVMPTVKQASVFFEPARYTRDQCWISKRQELLTRANTKKMLLFTYMRGGSSIGGTIFSRDPRAVYWYEPTAAFYMAYHGTAFSHIPQRLLYTKDMVNRISFDPEERTLLATYYDNLFKCQYSSMPSTTWMHPFITFSNSSAMHALKKCALARQRKVIVDKCSHLRSTCGDMEDSRELLCPEIIKEAGRIISLVPTNELSNISREEISKKLDEYIMLQHPDSQDLLKSTANVAEHLLCVERMSVERHHCLRDAEALCHEADIQAAKANRIKMEEVEDILLTIPDLHVVHYVRDPRGIAASRQHARGMKIDGTLMTEVEFLCRRIRDDLLVRRNLENRFPGAFLQVRYEDLVLDPLATAGQIYGFMRKNVSAEWTAFAQREIVGASGDDAVENSTIRVSKWESLFTEDELKVVNVYCKDVFHELGYNPA